MCCSTIYGRRYVSCQSSFHQNIISSFFHSVLTLLIDYFYDFSIFVYSFYELPIICSWNAFYLVLILRSSLITNSMVRSRHSASQIPRLAWKVKVHNMFPRDRYSSLSWASCDWFTPSHSTSLRSILISSSHLRLAFTSGLFSSCFPTRICIHFSSLLCMLHVPPVSSSLIYHPNNICWTVQTLKHFIMQFSLGSCYFFLISCKCSPQYFVPKHPQCLLFPQLWDPVSHPYISVFSYFRRIYWLSLYCDFVLNSDDDTWILAYFSRVFS
jgi:hypothetical protein